MYFCVLCVETRLWTISHSKLKLKILLRNKSLPLVHTLPITFEVAAEPSKIVYPRKDRHRLERALNRLQHTGCDMQKQTVETDEQGLDHTLPYLAIKDPTMRGI